MNIIPECGHIGKGLEIMETIVKIDNIITIKNAVVGC